MVGEEHKEFNTKTVEFVDIKHLMLKLEFPVVNLDYGAGAQIKVLGCRK